MMKKVILVCNAGMSTAMLAKRMQEASNGSVEVKAYGEAEFMQHVEGAVVILVGPQIRYRIADFQAETDIPVIGIQPQRYGIMDGKGVLEDIKQYL